MKKKNLLKTLVCLTVLLILMVVGCGKSSKEADKEPQTTDYEMLSKADSLVATEVTKIVTLDAPTIEIPNYIPDEEGNYYSSSHTGMQGGCFDGRYYYQTFIKYCYNNTKNSSGNDVYSKGVNNAKNLVVIVKYDVKSQEVVKVSEPLQLDHANDMTYNSNINSLIVAHNAPNRSTISFVDPETLELKSTSKVSYDLYGIDYDSTTDRYVFGVSGSYGFSAVNSLSDSGLLIPGVPESKAYTCQTLCCDENYVYCLFYGAKTNKLTGTPLTTDAIYVYDWDGNFVTFIEMDFGSEEVENISVVDGEIYVATLGILYKVGGLVEAE